MVTSRCPAAYATSPRTGRSARPVRPSASAFMKARTPPPIAPRRCITCAPDDGPTDGVGHPRRNRGGHRCNGLAHAYGVDQPRVKRGGPMQSVNVNGVELEYEVSGGRTRAAHQPRHRGRLPAAPLATGARRPLPADPVPQTGLGRKHPRRPSASRTTPPTPPRCSTISVCDPSTSQDTRAARRWPCSWRSTTRSTCTLVLLEPALIAVPSLEAFLARSSRRSRPTRAATTPMRWPCSWAP